MEYNFDATIARKQCVQWIRNWFEENGKGCNAVIGISGGKDSTVAAALCVEALGKDRVYGILMPNGYQSDKEDAKEVVKALGIHSCECNIGKAYNILLEETDWATMAFRTNISEQTKINLAPRIRMTMLYAISQSVNGRVVCTDNLSESFIGYSTRWGDNVGDFAPIAWFTSDEVVAIGDELGLPYELTHKTPADGLCGKTDEDNFGFTYEQLNTYIRTGECDDEAVKEKIETLYAKNVFKLNPIPKYVPTFNISY